MGTAGSRICIAAGPNAEAAASNIMSRLESEVKSDKLLPKTSVREKSRALRYRSFWLAIQKSFSVLITINLRAKDDTGAQ